MNTEERQLAEMLHRVTPEPPHRVTVEDVAYRLASEPQSTPPSTPGHEAPICSHTLLRSATSGAFSSTP